MITLTVGSAAPAKQVINAKLNSMTTANKDMVMADDVNNTDHHMNSEQDSRDLDDPSRIQVAIPG